MEQVFDPYHVWLGIPPQEQPPNHYRLLGIVLYESSADVIATAADRQMGHLRTFQSGKHSVLSQRLLNEVAAAKVCLLSPVKKAAYDAGARRAGGFVVDPNANPPIDEGAAIAAACYPAAIAADGAILRHFFDTVKPGVFLVTPAEGDICSGIKGVTLAALAHSYNESHNVLARLNNVTYYYSTQDPYISGYPGSFTWAATCTSPTTAPNGDLQWMATWTCNLNSAKVWVKAVATDNAFCRSLPHYIWIKIDSTRPAVINTHP